MLDSIPLEDAQELAWEISSPPYMFVARVDDGQSRWTNDWTVVFTLEDQLYGFEYREPATEMQEGMDDTDKFPDLNKGQVNVWKMRPVATITYQMV